MYRPQPLAEAPPAPETWLADACILDWIDSWSAAREDVLQLMAAYQRSDAGHDISGFLPLIEEADTTMRLLRYRVEWLRNYLGHRGAQPLDRP